MPVQHTFFVATNGNDNWSGRFPGPVKGHADGPFASLLRARNAARTVQGDKQIVIRGGQYFETALDLGPEDSGLVILGAAGETPVLYGGKLVTGWMPEGDRFFAASLAGVKEGKWDFRSLVVNDRLAARARYPESDGLQHCNEFTSKWCPQGEGKGHHHVPPATEYELTHMNYRPGDLGAWLDTRNAEITIYHQWDESMVGIGHLDEAARTITFTTPAGYPPGAFAGWDPRENRYGNPKAKKYAVWNIREGMTSPGQWYLDRSRGKLVYWPLPSEDMSAARVVAPSTHCVINIAGSEHAAAANIELVNLVISATTTPLVAGGFAAAAFHGAVSLSYASRCVLSDVTIRCVGGHAVKIGNTDGVRVERCVIRHAGAGGIYSYGAGSSISDNRIHDIGIAYPSAVGIMCGGRHTTVAHNEIHKASYTAIIAGGGDNLIENNLMYDIMTVMHDGAGIYIGYCTDVIARGNVVRFAHSQTQCQRHAYYMDEHADRCSVEGNLAVNCGWALQNNLAKRIAIRDNVIIDTGDVRITCCARELAFDRNIVYARGNVRVVMWGEPLDMFSSFNANILHSVEGTAELEWWHIDTLSSTFTPVAERGGSTTENPMFADAAAGDFRFRPGSPALKLGLPVPDFSRAGPRG